MCLEIYATPKIHNSLGMDKLGYFERSFNVPMVPPQQLHRLGRRVPRRELQRGRLGRRHRAQVLAVLRGRRPQQRRARLVAAARPGRFILGNQVVYSLDFISLDCIYLAGIWEMTNLYKTIFVNRQFVFALFITPTIYRVFL